MFAKTITAALAGTALLATFASAQTPTTQSPTTQTPTTQTPAAPAPTATGDTAKTSSTTLSSSQVQGDWRASKIVGLKVYNDQNESLGTINDLLMDKSGNIKAAVLGVGGFLGMGTHLVAVPLDKIKFVNEPVAYTGTASTSSGSGASGGGGAMTRPPTTTGSTSNAPSNAPATASKSNPWYPDHAVFNANKDELKAMPEFKFSE